MLGSVFKLGWIVGPVFIAAALNGSFWDGTFNNDGHPNTDAQVTLSGVGKLGGSIDGTLDGARQLQPVKCAAGEYEDLENNCKKCPSGMYSLEGSKSITQCIGCSIGYFGLLPGTAVCDRCPEFATTETTGSTAKEDCFCESGYKQSSATGAALQCDVCDEYREWCLHISKKDTDFWTYSQLCAKYPTHPQCTALQTHVNATQLLSYRFPCAKELGVCTGDSTMCSEADDGYRCASCKQGYGRNLIRPYWLGCVKCNAVYYVVLVFFVLCLIVFAGYMCWWSRFSDFSNFSHSMVLWRGFVFHFQLLNIIRWTFPSSTVSSADVLWTFFLGFPLSEILDCIIQAESLWVGNMDMKVYIGVALPLILLVLSAIIGFICNSVYTSKLNKGRLLERRKQQPAHHYSAGAVQMYPSEHHPPNHQYAQNSSPPRPQDPGYTQQPGPDAQWNQPSQFTNAPVHGIAAEGLDDVGLTIAQEFPQADCREFAPVSATAVAASEGQSIPLENLGALGETEEEEEVEYRHTGWKWVIGIWIIMYYTSLVTFSRMCFDGGLKETDAVTDMSHRLMAPDVIVAESSTAAMVGYAFVAIWLYLLPLIHWSLIVWKRDNDDLLSETYALVSCWYTYGFKPNLRYWYGLQLLTVGLMLTVMSVPFPEAEYLRIYKTTGHADYTSIQQRVITSTQVVVTINILLAYSFAHWMLVSGLSYFPQFNAGPFVYCRVQPYIRITWNLYGKLAWLSLLAASVSFISSYFFSIAPLSQWNDVRSKNT